MLRPLPRHSPGVRKVPPRSEGGGEEKCCGLFPDTRLVSGKSLRHIDIAVLHIDKSHTSTRATHRQEARIDKSHASTRATHRQEPSIDKSHASMTSPTTVNTRSTTRSPTTVTTTCKRPYKCYHLKLCLKICHHPNLTFSSKSMIPAYQTTTAFSANSVCMEHLRLFFHASLTSPAPWVHQSTIFW